MSAKATGMVWESALPRPEKYVLLAMADHAKDDGTDVYPSMWKIIWKTGYSETQVRDIMRSLMKQRILLLVHRGGKHDGDVNRYRIDLKAIPMLQEFKDWSAERRAEERKRKGTETAPSGVRKPHPQEGTVRGAGRVRFSQNEGTVATAPKPKPIEHKNIEQDLSNSQASCGDQQTQTQTQNQNLLNLPGIKRASELKLPEKAEPDPREPFLLKTIRGQWPQNCKCDITDADMSMIRRMLRIRHKWSEEELAICIVARFCSPDWIDPAQSVKGWIGSIAEFQSGPKNKFGHPTYAGAELDRWREQARVILYGPQPVQAKIPEPTPEQMAAAFIERVKGNANGPCHEAFQSLQQNFIRKLSKHTYDTWWKPLKPFCLTPEGVLYVQVPVQEFKNLRQRFSGDLGAWMASGSVVKEVEFVTLEELK